MLLFATFFMPAIYPQHAVMLGIRQCLKMCLVCVLTPAVFAAPIVAYRCMWQLFKLTPPACSWCCLVFAISSVCCQPARSQSCSSSVGYASYGNRRPQGSTSCCRSADHTQEHSSRCSSLMRIASTPISGKHGIKKGFPRSDGVTTQPFPLLCSLEACTSPNSTSKHVSTQFALPAPHRLCSPQASASRRR